MRSFFPGRISKLVGITRRQLGHRCPSSKIDDKNALLILGKTIRDDCISTDVSTPVNKEKVM